MTRTPMKECRECEAELMGRAAPRFGWKATPEGRTALIGILHIADAMGFRLDILRTPTALPEWRESHARFTALFPSFADFYNETRAHTAQASGYPGPLAPFGPDDSHTQQRYMYVHLHPAAAGSPRYYACPEHPLADPDFPGGLEEHYGYVTDAHPLRTGNLTPVYLRCALEIRARLAQYPIKPVTRAEAIYWGAPLDPRLADLISRAGRKVIPSARARVRLAELTVHHPPTLALVRGAFTEDPAFYGQILTRLLAPRRTVPGLGLRGAGEGPRWLVYRNEDGRLVLFDDYAAFVAAETVGLDSVDVVILGEAPPPRTPSRRRLARAR